MKIFTFPAWCNYGGGDSRDSWVEVELTDEEAERLIAYGTQPDIYYDSDFGSCEEISDIYQKVYAAAVDQMTDEILCYDDSLDDEYRNDPEWRADSLYQCDVRFPNEFEEMIVDEEEEEE